MKYVFTCILLLISLCGHGQITQNSLQSIDSLISADDFDQAAQAIKVIEEKSNSTDSLLYLVHILKGDLYLSQGKYIESINAYHKVLKQSVPTDSVNALKLAKGINDLGIAYYKIGLLDSAKWSHKRSIDIYKLYDYPVGLSYNFNNLSIIAKEEKRIDESLEMLEQALDASMKAGDSLGIGFIYLNLGGTYADNESSIKGLDYVYQSINVLDQIQNEQMSARAKVTLAALYNRLGSYDSALSLLQKASRYYQSQDNTRSLTVLSVRLAQIFIDLNQADSAKHYADMALKLAEENKRILNKAKALHLNALIAQKNNEYYRAIEYNLRGIAALEGKFKGQEFVIRTSLAKLYLILKQYDKALNTAQYALDEVGESPNPGSEVAAYEVLYKVNKLKGNGTAALQWLEKFKSTQDSLTSKEKSLEVARIEYRNHLELQERQNAIERAQMQSDYERDLEKQRWLQYSVTAGAGLLLIIVSLIYMSYKKEKRNNEFLEFKNETIAAKNEELLAKNEELTTLREKDYENQQREKRLLNEKIELRERELAANAMLNHEKNTILSTIESRLSNLNGSLEKEDQTEIKDLVKTIHANIDTKSSWDSFIHQFELVHPIFFQNLKETFPSLTVNDLKLCAYIKVGMDNKEIANASNLALSTIKKNINRLKKKLDLAPSASIRDYLIQYTEFSA